MIEWIATENGRRLKIDRSRPGYEQEIEAYKECGFPPPFFNQNEYLRFPRSLDSLGIERIEIDDSLTITALKVPCNGMWLVGYVTRYTLKDLRGRVKENRPPQITDAQYLRLDVAIANVLDWALEMKRDTIKKVVEAAKASRPDLFEEKPAPIAKPAPVEKPATVAKPVAPKPIEASVQGEFVF